jgi:hypothetical protein
MTRHEIEELARLLTLLPPAPVGWMEAAQELPQARVSLDELIVRAEQDAELRARVLADLEAAFAESNIRPTPHLLDEARRRLRS